MANAWDRARRAACAATVLMATACAPAIPNAAGGSPLILVLNAADRTVGVLDAHGRAARNPDSRRQVPHRRGGRPRLRCGDARHAYARRPGATQAWLIRVDVATGQEKQLAQLPGWSQRPGMFGDTLFTTDQNGGRVWALDRRTGDVTTSIPVGKRPTNVAVIR